MAARKDRSTREARERVRMYRERQAVHGARIRRRVRDNVGAGVVGGVLLLALVGVQTMYFTVGPGGAASVPTPTPTTSATIPGPLVP